MPIRLDILTLFTEMFPAVLHASMTGRAISLGAIEIHTHDIRAWAGNKHQKVDDRPFGGGPGMVLMAGPVADAVEAVQAMDARLARRILLSPSGRPLTQRLVEELASSPRVMLVCGHYEGIDQRAIDSLGLEEVSIGDFVVSGGELPAMLLADAIARLQPGVLGHELSAAQDSFSLCDPQGRPLLDCPHYTRPREWRGQPVPPVLLDGDHAAIAAWRLEQQVERTRERRPDLLEPRPLGHAPMSPRHHGLCTPCPC